MAELRYREALNQALREEMQRDESDFPPPESIYDHVYVLGDQVKGWYSVDERSAGVHKGEDVRSMDSGQRGPEDLYHQEVERAGREDVGTPKPADAAQEGDD